MFSLLQNLVFVEFKHETSKQEAVKFARHSKDSSVIPVTSPFLYFQNLSSNASGSPALPDSTEDCMSYDDKCLQKDLQKLDYTKNVSLAFVYWFNVSKMPCIFNKLSFLCILSPFFNP